MARQAQRDPAGLTRGAEAGGAAGGADLGGAATARDARRALLSGLIDHAALFPPGNAPMPAVVRACRRYSSLRNAAKRRAAGSKRSSRAAR